MLELTGVHKKYQMGDTTIFALRGVNLKIDDGDFIAIMGPSGSGKSTLMHVLGLLDVPDEGSYRLNGKQVAKLSEDELAVLRREAIGFIFQQFNLLPRMTALENVALPLLYSEWKMDLDRSYSVLDRVGLSSRVSHRPNELSGGQQQRVAIARALVNRPTMVLADEPTGNLDSQSEKDIIAALKELNTSGITVIIVTHEEDIGRHAKRLIRMRDGVIQSDERLEPLPTTAKRIEKKHTTPIKGLRITKVLQHFQQGIRTLAANKVRTALSMLGILIGVAAVVAMLALGRGAQNAIEAQLSSLGSNLLTLRSGAPRTAGGARGDAGSVTRLTAEDAIAIHEEIDSVKTSAPYVTGRGQVTYRNKNWSTSVIGGSPQYATMHAMDPTIGRFFTDEENKKRARVAVIGVTIVKEVFGDTPPIGEFLKINKVPFQVIGILPAKGSAGWRDQDDTVIIPVSTAMYRLLGKNFVDAIDIEVTDPGKTTQVQEDTMALMNVRHKIPPFQEEDSFQIMNMADIQAALTTSTKVMTLLLAIIAAISLLVGGIGIMNIMLVSVTERTREIGLRKAVGARRGDILSQFLVESVVVSAVGGLAGILLAWIITTVISAASGWQTVITVGSVLMAFFFSASIGIIFGIYPARKASLLPPIDALRYE